MALVGAGQVYRVDLAVGEEFVLHPKAVLAYCLPEGRRAEHVRLPMVRVQVPRVGLRVGAWVAGLAWVKVLRGTKGWEVVRRVVGAVRTVVFGDRGFWRFVGPATVLLQSRTRGGIREWVRREEVGDYAHVESKLWEPLKSGEVVEAGKREIGRASCRERVCVPV